MHVTHTQVLARAKAAPCLRVRGRTIARWAHHLANVLRCAADDVAIDAWLLHDDGPPAHLMVTALHPRTTDDANVLLRDFSARRTTYAHPNEHEDLDLDVVASLDGAAATQLSGHDAEVDCSLGRHSDVLDAMQRSLRSAFHRDDDYCRRNHCDIDDAGTVPGASEPTGDDGNDDDDESNELGRLRAAVARHLAGGDVLVSASGSAPADEYALDWDMQAHPSAFPNGTGARPQQMSRPSYVALLMRRFPRQQFQENREWLADSFNIHQRQAVLQHTNVRLMLQPYLVDALARMPLDEYAAVLELIMKGLRGKQQAEALRRFTSTQRALFRSFRTVATHVLGSPSSAASLRSANISRSIRFGTYTTFFTLNPSALNCEWAFRLCGRPYDFDDAGTPDARRPSTVLERWSIVARNPVAMAEFVYLFFDAFGAVFLGWPEKAERQHDERCLFGRVTCFSWRPETGARGGPPHGHGLIVQPALQTPVMLASENRARVFAFLESFAAGFLDAPFHSLMDKNTPVSPRFEEDRLYEVQTLVANDASGFAQQQPTNVHTLLATQPPLHDVDAAARHSAKVNHRVQNHHHTFTCDKTGNEPSDDNCREQLPQGLVPHTSFVEVGGQLMLLMKRCGRFVVPFTPALSYASPCNNAIYIIADGGRYLRQNIIKLRAAAAKHKTPVIEPPPAPEVHSALTSSYCSKYQSKVEGQAINTAVLEAACTLPRRDHATTAVVSDDPRRRARARLAHAINLQIGAITFPVTLAAFFLRYDSDSFATHSVAYLDVTSLLQRWPLMPSVMDVSANADEVSCDFVPGAGPRGTSATFATDYLHRGNDLQLLPPYVFCAWYHKVRFVTFHRLHLSSPSPDSNKK
jgi:hypothetical protein